MPPSKNLNLQMSVSPGTSDRVLLLSGTLHSVLTAVFLILEKVSRDVNKSAGNSSSIPRGTRGDVEVGINLGACVLRSIQTEPKLTFEGHGLVPGLASQAGAFQAALWPSDRA